MTASNQSAYCPISNTLLSHTDSSVVDVEPSLDNVRQNPEKPKLPLDQNECVARGSFCQQTPPLSPIVAASSNRLPQKMNFNGEAHRVEGNNYKFHAKVTVGNDDVEQLAKIDVCSTPYVTADAPANQSNRHSINMRGNKSYQSNDVRTAINFTGNTTNEQSASCCNHTRRSFCSTQASSASIKDPSSAMDLSDYTELVRDAVCQYADKCIQIAIGANRGQRVFNAQQLGKSLSDQPSFKHMYIMSSSANSSQYEYKQPPPPPPTSPITDSNQNVINETQQQLASNIAVQPGFCWPLSPNVSNMTPSSTFNHYPGNFQNTSLVNNMSTRNQWHSFGFINPNYQSSNASYVAPPVNSPRSVSMVNNSDQFFLLPKMARHVNEYISSDGQRHVNVTLNNDRNAFNQAGVDNSMLRPGRYHIRFDGYAEIDRQ